MYSTREHEHIGTLQTQIKLFFRTGQKAVDINRDTDIGEKTMAGGKTQPGDSVYIRNTRIKQTKQGKKHTKSIPKIFTKWANHVNEG